MKKWLRERVTKKKLWYFCVYLIVMITLHYGQYLMDDYKDIKYRMYDDFEEFGKEVEKLNDRITEIFVIKDFSQEKKEYFNSDMAQNLWMSNVHAMNRDKGTYLLDVRHLYYEVNETIPNILSDHVITKEEEKYLKTLYEYNEELIHECKKILGDAYGTYNYEKEKKLERKIIKIYGDYSEKAEELLDTPQYSFLKEYGRKYEEEIDSEDAKKYCEEVFAKVVEKAPLIEDLANQSEYAYEFDATIKNKEKYKEYQIEFNKETKEIFIRYDTYLNSDGNRKTQEQLDEIANNLAYGYNPSLSLYDKKIDYDHRKNIDSIDYVYIFNNNGVYEENTKVEFTLKYDGMMECFKTIYFNEEIKPMPKTIEDEIIKRINKEAQIKDAKIIRNRKGNIEYTIHLRYNNQDYYAVFDEKGKTIDYGKILKQK